MPRRAASTIGTGWGGAMSSLNPVSVRSPASAGRRKSTAAETRLSGLSNGIWFQPSTIRSDEAPMPRTNRPFEASASPAACCASSAGPRVKTPTTPVPSRIDGACSTASTSGVKPSGPLVSPDHRSV